MSFRCAQWRAIDGRAAASEAKVLGGEQSLLPLMRLRLAPPTALVDIQDVGDLRFVACDGELVRIGALTRHGDLEQDPVIRA